MFASLGGTVIKPFLIGVIALSLGVTPSQAVMTTEVAKAKVKLSPSPSPTWPPKGFVKSLDGNAYAKIPTTKELVGLASGDKALTRALAQKIDGTPVCEKFSCGAVQVASLRGCTWWVITADVTGVGPEESKKLFGNVRTTLRETGAKKYSTALIISQEPIELHHTIRNIKAVCRQDVPNEKVPTTTYTVVP